MLVSAPGRPGPPRVGLVVPRSVGTAVKRNRVKRRLRHAVAGKGLEPGVDYVIVASRQVAEASFAEIETWIIRALGETG